MAVRHIVNPANAAVMPKPKPDIEQSARPTSSRSVYSTLYSILQLIFLQLETTVTKLQLAMGFSTEQVTVMPPPLLKIRELEQENARLQKENEELRRLLTDSSSRSLDTRRAASYDLRGCDRDYGLKRRKPGHEGMYLVSPTPSSMQNDMFILFSESWRGPSPSQ